MKKAFYLIVLFALSIIIGLYSYNNLTGKLLLLGIFFAGFGLGLFLMGIKLNAKSSTLNSYKRELEKESISSDENSARVKVLESKIEVLEKALENALKK